MAIENNDAENNIDDGKADTNKKDKVAKKLEAMGMMSSGKKSSVDEESPKSDSHLISSVLLALIVVLPVAAVVAYIAVPDKLNELISLDSNAAAVATTDINSNGVQVAPIESSNRAQHRERMEQLRAEMKDRRTKFDKQNANNYAANRTVAEPPQWVKDRQAQMEQRRSEFENQNANNNLSNRASSEPPQWFKDQQAFMQQEQERYRQEMAKRHADMSRNRAPAAPGYMNNPGMNAYQPQTQSNQAPANIYQQNPGPYYRGYPQQVNPYYYNNGPYFGPQNAPYGQYGYPSR